MNETASLRLRRMVSLAIGALRNAGHVETDAAPRIIQVPQPRDSITLQFGGDLHHAESQGGAALKRLEELGWNYGLERLRPLLAAADLAVVNLETPLVQPQPTSLEGRKPRVHWGHPTETPRVLRSSGIRLVSLANNHSMDYGESGLVSTLQALGKHDISWVGAGLNYAEAAQPVMLTGTVGGAPFHWIVLAGLQYFPGYDALYRFYARKNRGGVAVLLAHHMARRIRHLRMQYPDATIMVYPHWGYDYMRQLGEQVVMARAWIDAGADLVIGHGSHILQGVERYHGKWIFYGIGSFMFLQRELEYERLKLPAYGMAVQVRVERENGRWKNSFRVYPVQADAVVTDDQPRPLTRDEFSAATQFLLNQSPNPAELKTLLHEETDAIGPCWVF